MTFLIIWWNLMIDEKEKADLFLNDWFNTNLKFPEVSFMWYLVTPVVGVLMTGYSWCYYHCIL